MKYLSLLLSLVTLCSVPSLAMKSCHDEKNPIQKDSLVIGAAQWSKYLPLLDHKRVMLYGNHTSMVGDEHLLDLLISKGVDVTGVFGPEHGFRGHADAGEHVNNNKDVKTGVPIYSLYNGKNGKPSAEQIQAFDVLIVDIQDVGLRFYTYYISMIKLMESCADNDKQIIILDRPNPNGYRVDGPILDMKYKSGVGYLPIPIMHGMTLGELALMAQGEGWLETNNKVKLTVVPCLNYTRDQRYSLPIAPSPNLRSDLSIALYPSLCYFEATSISLGRGTMHPFECFGHPSLKTMPYQFTPMSMPGAKNPPQLGHLCFGRLLTNLPIDSIRSEGVDLSYLIEAYRAMPDKRHFFTSFFENLIGVGYVREMIINGHSAQEIKQRWAPDVEKFRKERRPYLLYPDSSL
ncbi:MAG: DUF1343 domain-containing protein [Bacteroidaceae bacterium]